MKTAKKVSIIVAVVLVLVGFIISFVALLAIDFDFTRMNTISFVKNTYSVEEVFTNISVEGAECDVRLALSDDGDCKVICSESNKIYHSVAVNNNTLTVERIDNRKWYEHIGIYWGRMEIVVYLPQNEYESLYVKSLSGDIEIPEEFSFGDAEINNTSGDIKFSATVNNDLKLKSVSGDVNTKNITCENLNVQSTSGDVVIASLKVQSELKVKTVSGNIETDAVECDTLIADSTSGDVELSEVMVTDSLKAEAVSGNVELMKSDADSLKIKTVSGDVYGTLLSKKIFLTDTESGDVDVPNSASGGKCEIKTTSGNIEFSVVK